MTDQSSKPSDDQKTHTGVAEGEHDAQEPKDKPSADEPVTGEEHDPQAVKEASERMLNREPED